jgi:nucleoside-diphosphate-sugar epimerase
MDIDSEDQLDELLSRPPAAVVELFARLDGDLLVLGAGGKMGPSLVRMAARAVVEAGVRKRIVAVSRFSDGALQARIEGWGVEAIACDLLEPGALGRLPRCPNVVYMPARKFGSAGAEWETWATNAYLPGEAARAFAGARVVAFSTGNVYPLWPVDGEGPDEAAAPGPIGEYAQSCLGRERILEYWSRRDGTPMTLLRLNYAVELRYGVLADLARKVATDTPIDLSMGHVNLIWQGDANAVALRAFGLCASPPAVLNVTGPLVRVRDLAERLGELMGRRPRLTGTEQPTALISNAGRCRALYGAGLDVETMLGWVARWVGQGGSSLGKPTRFDVRDGRF